MGQCYSVRLRMKPKDDIGFVRESRKYATDNGWPVAYRREMCSVDKVVKTMTSDSNISISDDGGWIGVVVDFNAPYYWESVLCEWFSTVACMLEDGSEIEVSPDKGKWKYVVREGIAVCA